MHLRWSDVQFDDARVFVRRSLSWSRGLEEEGRVRPKFYEPKTRSGYRTLPLPAALVAALKSLEIAVSAVRVRSGVLPGRRSTAASLERSAPGALSGAESGRSSGAPTSRRCGTLTRAD